MWEKEKILVTNNVFKTFLCQEIILMCILKDYENNVRKEEVSLATFPLT